MRVVQDYTRCMITYLADKLPACGAIAAASQRARTTSRVCGVILSLTDCYGGEKKSEPGAQDYPRGRRVE